MNIGAYRGFIFDLDGVLWRGGETIEGAPDVINALRSRGKSVMFATNNSSVSHADMVAKLKSMGFQASPGEVFSATRVTAEYLASLRPHSTAYVIGNRGLVYELEAAGLQVLPAKSEGFRKTDFLVVGNDREINYDKFTCALWALDAGAIFVAVNRDALNPVPGGVLPGAGTIVAAVEAAGRRSPDIMIGKPSTVLLEMAIRHAGLDRASCAMVGDTLETDILAGMRLGIGTILVLTGNATRKDITESLNPDWVIPSVRELVSGM